MASIVPTKNGGLKEAVTFVKVKVAPKEGQQNGSLSTTWN
jgi:hypothetical protein